MTKITQIQIENCPDCKGTHIKRDGEFVLEALETKVSREFIVWMIYKCDATGKDVGGRL